MKLRFVYGFIAFLLLWTIVTFIGLVNPLLVPPPWKVAVDLYESFVNLFILKDLAITALRTILGFVIASTLGILSGTLLARNKLLSDMFFPIIEFFRSLPAVALIPMFMVLFGIGEVPKILLAGLAAGFIILIGTFYAVKNVRLERLSTAKWLHATQAETFFKVILWDAMPGIVGSLRQGFSVALIVVLVSEMLTGTTLGLGLRIYEASLLYKMSHMYGVIILVGLFGYCGNKLIEILEKKFIHWAGR